MNKGAHSSKRRQFDIKFKRDLIEEFDKLQSKGKVNKSLFSLNHGITTSTFMSEHLNSLYEAALLKVAEKPKQLKISDMFRK